MSVQDNFDRVMDSWLADGPERLSEAAIDRIVGDIEQLNERKPFWLPGRETMNRLVIAAGSVAAVVLIAAIGIGLASGGGLFGPAGQPSPTPSPTINPLLYVSDRHGYSLVLPNAQWQVSEEEGTWEEGEIFTGPPAVGSDVFVDPDVPDVLRFMNSQSVTSGATFDEWLQAYDPINLAAFPDCSRISNEDHVAGGETGRLRTWNCAGADEPIDDADSAVFEVMHGDRAYVFRFLGDGFQRDERALLIDWLATLQFTDTP